MPFFNKDTARIKMVALTQNGYENIVWYNLDKFNETKYTDEYIIKGMLRRAKGQRFISTVQVIQFYDNSTGKLLQEFKE